MAATLAYVKQNQPVVITCCSAPGMTSPITVGGTVVQNNAEVLAGIIMTQVANPGVPVVYGNVTYSADMRQAVPISWGPEDAVFMQYAKAMADFYGIHSRVGGSLSGAKQLDWQDGAATAVSLMTTFDCDKMCIRDSIYIYPYLEKLKDWIHDGGLLNSARVVLET